MVTPELIRELLDYYPENGILIWKRRDECSSENKRWNRRYAGKRAGSYDKSNKYRNIVIKTDRNRKYKEHRLVWLYVTGEWPKDEVDHRACDYSRNSFSNLREATRAQNCRNQVCRNPTGRKGVTKRRGRWRAQICCDRRKIYLGSFGTIDEAAAAYVRASLRYHGEFGRSE